MHTLATSSTKRSLLRHFISAFVTILFLCGIYITFFKPHAIQQIGVAAPYVWPAGCPQREYKKFDQIPSACAADQYSMGGGQNYGFYSGHKGGTNYFRIGNDAIDISCKFYNPYDCTAFTKYKNAFVDKER